MSTLKESRERRHKEKVMWFQCWQELYKIHNRHKINVRNIGGRIPEGIFYVKDQNNQVRCYMSILIGLEDWKIPFTLVVIDPKEYGTRYITNKLNVMINYAKENKYLIEIDVINDKRELSGTFQIREGTANYSKNSKIASMIAKGNPTPYSAREEINRIKLINSLNL